jgi:hypothetical protein
MTPAGHGVGIAGIPQLPLVTQQNPCLVRRGRWLRTEFLLEAGETSFLISILDGQVVGVQEGPFVMPSWAFALRATRQEWDAFWVSHPAPGSHDLFAMVKRKALRIEGELHPFMSNLLYFKLLLASLREPAP